MDISSNKSNRHLNAFKLLLTMHIFKHLFWYLCSGKSTNPAICLILVSVTAKQMNKSKGRYFNSHRGRHQGARWDGGEEGHGGSCRWDGEQGGKGRGRGQGHRGRKGSLPEGLRGREIGMWYAARGRARKAAEEVRNVGSLLYCLDLPIP